MAMLNVPQEQEGILAPEEWKTILEYIKAVKEEGFGSVCIEFDNHHPSKVQITGSISKLLSRLKPRTYKAE